MPIPWDVSDFVFVFFFLVHMPELNNYMGVCTKTLCGMWYVVWLGPDILIITFLPISHHQQILIQWSKTIFLKTACSFFKKIYSELLDQNFNDQNETVRDNKKFAHERILS